jgi:signal transduction histidine kinase/ligand-binding sensor domain-containing protein
VPNCEGSAKAQVPPPGGQKIIHESWKFKDGAPEQPRAFAQTADGYLWVGAPAGLFRFDGVRFELFRSPFGDQLQSTNVSALFAPSHGGLWVGYVFGGFSFLSNGRITNFVDGTGSVFGFAEDRNGTVWCAASRGLWRFDGSSWQSVGTQWGLIPKQSMVQVGLDREGTLWALAGTIYDSVAKQLYFLLQGERQFRKAGDNLFVRSFTWDADGTVLTTHEKRSQDRGSGIELEIGLPAYPILKKDSEQVVDRANRIWFFGPYPILNHPANEPLPEIARKVSAQNSEAYDIDFIDYARLVDREGSIWIGADTGVHRFSYSPLMQQELPKPPGPFFVVAPDEGGVVWISAGSGMGSSAVYRVANGKANLQKILPGASSFAYRAPDKTIWFGGEGGVWHMVNGSLKRVELPPEMVRNGNAVFTMTQDEAGGEWLSFGNAGLYRFKDGVWTRYEARQSPPNPLPQSMPSPATTPGCPVLIAYTDTLKRVWFGCTKNQLAVLDADRMQIFGPKNGIQVGNITAFYGRGSGVWIGGEFGLQQFDHGRFHNINAMDKESLRGISGIVETANGDLWLNGLGGIVHIRRAEIVQALNNPSYQVSAERFDRRAGLPGLPSQLRYMPTATEGTDGRLWFNVNNGVVWLDPNQASIRIPPPPVSIQSISADDQGFALDQPVKLPPHTGNVQISWAAISLLHPEAIHYRYKMRSGWHDVGTSNSVSYRNLPPGSYHFVVAAGDSNGVWSNNTATAEFMILPAYYQTNWFRAACLAAFLMSLWALYQLRLRQMAKQFNVRFEERVGERTRIARDLHDTLLQSFHGILLHFQTGINQLPERPDDARKTLEKAMHQARLAIVEGREAIQGLRSSVVETNDLAPAIRTLGEELATGSNAPPFQVHVEGTPRDLHPILRDEVYRITGEGIRNAFRHADAKQIEVEIYYDDARIRVRVRDDGKGIDPKLLSGNGREGHFGLPGMRERAKLIAGKLTVWSEPGSGTEVELSIPASRAYTAPARGNHTSIVTKFLAKLSGHGTAKK